MNGWHILPHNVSTATPSNMLFIDTETAQHGTDDPLVTAHTFRLGVMCHIYRHGEDRWSERWATARSVGEVWDFVKSCVRPKSKLWVFAHNWNFDFFVINGFEMLRRSGFTLKHFIFDSNIFIVSAELGGGKVVFVDTFNYVRSSLERIGEFVGLEKLKVDFGKVGDQELEMYCKRDVEIIVRFMTKLVDFVKENDLGKFAYTISGQAFTAFRHRFMKDKIYIHNHAQARDLERRSYRGGRCECFRLGEFKGERFYKLDVNSMYGWAMSSHEYPAKLVTVCRSPTLHGLKRAMDDYLVIADVKIKVEGPAIAAKKTKLLFPVGTFRAVLTSPEIEWVLERGRVLEVYSYVMYEKRRIFADYVKHFYALKRRHKADPTRISYELCKLFLNGLYGKFGQRNQQFKRVGRAPDMSDGVYQEVNGETGETLTYWIVGGEEWVTVGDLPARHNFTAVASFTTAYARMYLWRLIERAGVENVYYVDTDSLIVNERGHRNLLRYVDEVELGKLKVEKIADLLRIDGAKRYLFGEEFKCKGVSSKAKKLDENTFVQDQFLKSRSLLRRGITDHVLVRSQTKVLRSKYDKGVVLPDGRVVPFTFSE